MPRKNPLPLREKEICGRVRELRREILGLSLTVAACKLQMDSSRLASYEHARVPLKMGFVWMYSKTFNVSFKWIAEGFGRPIPERPIPASVLAATYSRRFSEVYDTVIKPTYQDDDNNGLACISDLLFGFGPIKTPVDASTLLDLFSKLLGVTQDFYHKAPPGGDKALISMLAETLIEFRMRHLDNNAPSREPAVAKEALTQCFRSVNIAAVKSPLASLLDRARALTRDRGMKSVLAKALGVPLASVSQWMSGERDPNGETTLKMLNWVEQQERK